MSLVSKLVQLAPVILATGTTISLLSLKISDPGTKKVVHIIALMTGLGTAFALIVQLPTVVSAIEETIRNTSKLWGLDDESRLTRIKLQADIEIARVQADANLRAIAAKSDADRIAYERQKETDRLAYERRVADENRALALSRSAIEQDKTRAEFARVENERLINEARRNERRAGDDDAAKRADEQTKKASQAMSYCNTCCAENARKVMRESQNAVGVCITECVEQKSSEWFGHNVILCRR